MEVTRRSGCEGESGLSPQLDHGDRSFPKAAINNSSEILTSSIVLFYECWQFLKASTGIKYIQTSQASIQKQRDYKKTEEREHISCLPLRSLAVNEMFLKTILRAWI